MGVCVPKRVNHQGGELLRFLLRPTNESPVLTAGQLQRQPSWGNGRDRAMASPADEGRFLSAEQVGGLRHAWQRVPVVQRPLGGERSKARCERDKLEPQRL